MRLTAAKTLFPYTTLFRSLGARVRPYGAHLGAERGLRARARLRSEEQTSELQSLTNIVCRLAREKKIAIKNLVILQKSISSSVKSQTAADYMSLLEPK